MPKLLDITGRRFSRLLVIRKSERQDQCALWVCVCDCGTVKEIRSSSLRSGITKSCGCLSVEVAKKRAKGLSGFRVTPIKKHGMCISIEYRTWASMKYRCTTQTHASFKRYGARGIDVCPEWMSGFEAFYKDMGERPGPGYSLDRIDNNKGYNKENCRWATKKEQMLNTSQNVYIELGGKRMTITQWSRYLGGAPQLVRTRLTKGWSLEKALTTKVCKVDNA